VEPHAGDLIGKLEQVVSIEKYEVVFRALVTPHFGDQKMSRPLLNQTVEQTQSAPVRFGILRSELALFRRVGRCFVVDYAYDYFATFLLKFVSNG
jgi:hypothetical protein